MKKYEMPIIEVVEVDCFDVVCASNSDTTKPIETDVQWFD